MFNDLKLSFQSFKKNIADYLSISFVFSVLLFVGVLLSEFCVDPIISFVAVVIPAIISLKFCAFHANNKEQIEFKNMKIGFLTFFKSIKIYLIVILKPFLIAFGVSTGVFSLFYYKAFEISAASIPDLYNKLLNADTMMYAFEDMQKIEGVKTILAVGVIVSLIAAYFVCFSCKLKRDFIPFVAFEMPINSKKAVDMNYKMVKGNYFKLFVSNLVVDLMYLVPVGLCALTAYLLSLNEIYSLSTIYLVSSMVLCVFSGPVSMIKQIHYVYSYKTYSKPMKEDFDNELKNILKEIEELQKKINNKN